MSPTSRIVHHAVVSLKLPTQVAALVPYTRGIVKAMTGNPAFPNPTPTLAAITTAVDGLQGAVTAALTRATGTVAIRNEKHTALVQLLVQLKAYIQAQADANPENGASIIQSAGVGVRKTVTRRARVFAAKPGAVSGTAKLVAATAAHRASYEWEYSSDGGKTWIAAQPTLQARTTVSGLPSASTVQFRYRAVTKTGATDWSAPVSLVMQ